MTWLGWIGRTLGNFWTSGPRRKLHRALHPAGKAAPAAARRRVAERYGRSFPASATRLQVDLLLQALDGEDVAGLRTEAAKLTEITSAAASEWSASAAAVALGAVIERLLARGGAEGLRLALAAFADFRRQSPAAVPEAMPLFEAAAQRKIIDPATARGYVEYLWACRDPQGKLLGEQTGRDAVLGALQIACAPDRPEADRLNRLVSQWLELPWANLNLLHWYVERKKLPEAAEEWQTARSRGFVPDDPDLLLRVGAIHRELARWVEAEQIFAECMQLEPADAPRRQSAEVFHLEARCQRIAAELSRGESASERPFDELYGEVQSLYARHRKSLADADDDEAAGNRMLALLQGLVPILLDLDSRLDQPRVAIARAFGHPAEFSLNGHGHCLDHIGQLSPAAHGSAWSASQGSRRQGLVLLARGHLHSCAKLIQALRGRHDVPTADLHLLEARLALRSGQFEAAREHTAATAAAGLGCDLLLPLEVELALAELSLSEAEELLSRPAARLLPLVERELLHLNLLGLAGDWRENFARMQQLLAKIPDSPHVLTACGWECLFAGQDELACECFFRTLAIDTAHHDARLGRWLAAAKPDPSDAQQLQSNEPSLAALARPRRVRLVSAGRHDLVARLDQDLVPTAHETISTH